MQIDRERLAHVLAKALTGGGLSGPKSIDHTAIVKVLSDIEAQGFAIVPHDPTEAMQEAGSRAISDWMERKAEDAVACWRAMVDAAEGVSHG